MKTRAPAEQGPSADARASVVPRTRARRRLPNGDRARSGAWLTAGPATPCERLAVADPGTMIGRQPELGRLRALWKEASADGPRLVLLAGEPGVGKTRLAAEVADAVEASGGRVLVGRCHPDRPIPYDPILEALAPAVHGESDEWLGAQVEDHGPALARLFPELGVRLDKPATDQQVAPRTRLFGAMAGAITGLADEAVMLVVEDLHWATRSTVLALDHLVRQGSAPLLVVGTYRDAAIHPAHPLGGLLDSPPADRLERMVLADLSPQSVTALLVDRVAVAGKAAANLASTLWRTTKGNPLVLTEVVRDLVSAGALAGGTVREETIAKIGLASDIAEVVGRRLSRLTSSARSVLDAAAVVGTTFSDDLVGRLAGQKDDDVRAALAAATSAAVVAPIPGQAGHHRFLHDLVRAAIYELLPPQQRVRIHHDLAALFLDAEGHGTVPPAVLVRHLAAASPVGKSPGNVDHAIRAGQSAMNVLAYDEAAEAFGQALAFLGTAGNPALRADLLMLLADAYHRGGESARARQSYLQAAAVARANQDGPRLGRAVLGLGDVLGVWGADSVLIALLDEGLETNAEDPSLRAKLLARLAQARAAFDTPDERKAQSDRAWELAWDSRDPETMGAVLRARHEALSAPDDMEDRVEIDGELYAMASSAKDPSLGLLAHGWRLVDLLEQGHLVDADRDRKLHAELARRSGDPRHRRDAELWAAAWDLLEGKSGAAATHIDKALALGQQARDPDASSHYWVQQLDLLLEWGSDAELDELIDVWYDLVRSHDRAPAWRSSLALLLARRGNTDEAAAELADMTHQDCADLPLDRAWIPTVAALAEVATLVHDDRTALLGKLLAPYSRRMIVVGPGLVCRGAVARVLGLVATSAANWTSAERQFQAAMAAHERVDAAPLVARTRSEFGRALAAKPGGRLNAGRAKEMLLEAAEEADRLGMSRLLDETEAALGSLR